METTFLIAHRLAVSPFEVMKQDIEHVIMIVNYFIDCAEDNTQDSGHAPSEKEQDKSFWSAL